MVSCTPRYYTRHLHTSHTSPTNHGVDLGTLRLGFRIPNSQLLGFLGAYFRNSFCVRLGWFGSVRFGSNMSLSVWMQIQVVVLDALLQT